MKPIVWSFWFTAAGTYTFGFTFYIISLTWNSAAGASATAYVLEAKQNVDDVEANNYGD